MDLLWKASRFKDWRHQFPMDFFGATIPSGYMTYSISKAFSPKKNTDLQVTGMGHRIKHGMTSLKHGCRHKRCNKWWTVKSLGKTSLIKVLVELIKTRCCQQHLSWSSVFCELCSPVHCSKSWCMKMLEKYVRHKSKKIHVLEQCRNKNSDHSVGSFPPVLTSSLCSFCPSAWCQSLQKHFQVGSQAISVLCP